MRFFDPELEQQYGLAPFFYTEKKFYDVEEDPQEDDLLRNCREWQTYLGKDVELADIKLALYGDQNPRQILAAADDRSLGKLFPNNSFIQKLLAPGYRAVLDYFLFTKKIEVSQAFDDPWNDWPLQKPDITFWGVEAQQKAVSVESITRLQSAADPFLQKRYAYQAVVCQRYSGKDSLAVALYDQNFSPKDTTILRPWALLHKAECLFHLGDSLQYNYLLAKVFDACYSKRRHVAALFVLDWTEKTLALAPTPSDKALVLTMKAIQYPGQGGPMVQRIAKLNPTSHYLPLLISREINKLENWTLTKPMTGLGGANIPEDVYAVLYSEKPNAQAVYEQKAAAWQRKNAKKDRLALHEMRLWIEKLLFTNALPSHRDFLQLASAHLNFLEGNYGSAQAFLNKISAGAGARLQQQRLVEQILLIPHTQDLQQVEVLENLRQQLEQFWANRQYTDHYTLQMSRLHFYLCQAFFQAGNIPVAGLFYNKAWLTSNAGSGYHYNEYQATGPTVFLDAHATVADLDKLIDWRKKGPSSKFEKYLLERPATSEGKIYPDGFFDNDYQLPDSTGESLPSLADLIETQGSIAFRDGDLVRAKACFDELPADHWADYDFVDLNVFADANHFPFEGTNTIVGSKRELVDRMVGLEAESHRASGERLAEIYYQLGNAWFNCSYWGRSWSMFSNERSLSEDDRPQIRNAGTFQHKADVRKYGGTYYRFDRAITWYRRALAASSSHELASRVEYMLADCDRYVRIMHSGTDYYYNAYDIKKLPSSPLFRQWQARYGQTVTYAERIAHCPELRDYLGVKK